MVLLLWLLLVVVVGPILCWIRIDGISFSIDGRFTGTRLSWVAPGGGWLGLRWEFGCSGGCHDSGPRPRLLKRKAMREEVWMKLKDRVEQRRFFSSSTLPPGLAAIINHGRAIGEEGLGFWALKSERGWITGCGAYHQWVSTRERRGLGI